MNTKNQQELKTQKKIIVKKAETKDSGKQNGLQNENYNKKDYLIMFGSIIFSSSIAIMASSIFLQFNIYISALFFLFYVFLIPFWLFIAAMLLSYLKYSKASEICFISGVLVFGMYVSMIFVIILL